MKIWERILPWAVVALGGIYLASNTVPRHGTGPEYDLDKYAALPVVYRGRVQPIDTLARTSLMIVSGRQTFAERNKNNVEVSGQPAIRWYLDVVDSSDGMLEADGGPAFLHRVFRIENDEVLGLLELRPRSGFRYSLSEIVPKIREFVERARTASQKDPKRRDVYENKLVELANHLELFQNLASHASPLVVPPPSAEGEEWYSFRDVEGLLKKGHKEILALPAVKAYALMMLAHREGNVKEFNDAVTQYTSWLDERYPREMGLTRLEVFFNRFAPFYHCAILYAVVFVLAALSWLGLPSIGRAAFWLGVLTLVVHSWALIARMYIQGRPPVTNLYSSAIFIGWGCVVLCLVLEAVYRNSIGTLVAALTGALTLLIAHMLGLSGDTLEMMQAVLDTNFWLATHVTCVTLGYTATFVAGFLGIYFIVAGLLTSSLRGAASQTVSKMIYGVVCFAMLLSFVGTVLGGIWADQSWGRFWGWDPKENGALLIVLWNALILHARWGGMVKPRGIAVLAVLGNVVTAWSWFGVNMLGIGLHAYGFIFGAVFWLLVFVFSQIGIALIGLIPLKRWNSFSPLPPAPPPSLQNPPRRDLSLARN